MTRDDVLRMAREAGLEIGVAGVGVPQRRLTDGPVDAPWLRDALERFAALVAADANAARIAAQIENEALKARIVASGVAERRAVHKAVLAEREACALVCEVNHGTIKRNPDSFQIAAAIRARGAA